MQIETTLGQTLGQVADDDISLWRVVLALAICLALAVGAAFVLRSRLGRGMPFSFFAPRQRRLHLTETLRLGHQVDLCIVTCDGRELLITTSAHGSDLLEHLPPSGAGIAREPANRP